MSDEQKREVWGDYTPLDLTLAKALAPFKGWTVLEGEGAAYFTNGSREWVSACLVVGDDMQLVEIPPCSRSVDAVLALLPDGFTVSIQRRVPDGYLAHIRPFMSKLGWNGEGATRAEALANAALVWAEAQKGAGDE